MLHRTGKLSENVAYGFFFLALIVFLFLVHLITVLLTLGKQGVVKSFCGSFISQIPVFLYSPFLFLFLPAKEMVSFQVWLCKVIVLSLMDFPFETVPSV